MPVFRYHTNSRWWKGNTHVHSTASDGGKTFRELADLYQAQDYHFLFRTDHWVASDTHSDPDPYPILWLDGIELDGRDLAGSPYHVVALGSFQGIESGMGFQPAIESARAQGGMLILAHPLWMGNTLEEALRWQFDGVEIYNHVCHWLNGKGDGITYWNAMLMQNPNTLAFSADDAHINPGDPQCNGGWVMVNAEECTPEAILSALRTGNFYSTVGPQFETIAFDGSNITMRCSPVQFARLIGPRWNGSRAGSFDGSMLTEASFSVPETWQYAYLEIEDHQGRRAWTNPLFVR